MCVCTNDRNDFKLGTVVVLNTLSQPTDFGFKGGKGYGYGMKFKVRAGTRVRVGVRVREKMQQQKTEEVQKSHKKQTSPSDTQKKHTTAFGFHLTRLFFHRLFQVRSGSSTGLCQKNLLHCWCEKYTKHTLKYKCKTKQT